LAESIGMPNGSAFDHLRMADDQTEMQFAMELKCAT